MDTSLYSHIKRHIDENDFVSKYIFSGLSPDRSFEGKLTKELFKEHFYVEIDKDIQSKYREKLNELFNDTSNGVLGIRAHGGSGKTTSIEMISLDLNLDISKYTIGFLAGDDNYIGAINRINKICINKFRNKIGNAQFCNYLMNNVCKVTSILSNSGNDYEIYLQIWQVVQSTKLNDLLKEAAITAILRNFNLDNTIYGLKISLLLLSLLIISYDNYVNKKGKYLVVFDNIEFITSNSIGDKVYDCWTYLSNFYECDDDLNKIFNKIKFAVCARTTTGLSALQNNIGACWGDDDKYIIDIESGDFCAEALLKKLYFLHKNDLKNTKTYSITKLICQLICGINNTNAYMTYGKIVPTNKGVEYKDAEYTYFAKKYFSPFFGNDFRLLASSICNCLLDSQNTDFVDKIKELLIQSIEQPDLYEFSINGARNILWYLIFNKLSKKEFSYLGIQPIEGANRNHSPTRIILSYMYWHKIRHLLSNNWNEDSYSGIGLSQLTQKVLRFFYSDKDIAQTIYRLSNLSSYYEKPHTYFITINDHSVAKYLKDGELPPPNYVNNVELNLSPAGLCYVNYVSTHFEFFSARDKDNIAMPLIMYDSANDENGEVYKVINNIYNRITNYIDGMVMNCKKGCSKFKKQSALVCSYKRASQDELNVLDIFNCNLCVRLIQVHATIISIIDYIDRYRLYQISKEFDATIKKLTNINLLNQIEKFAGLFKKTKDMVNFPDNQFYNFLFKIYRNYNTLDNGAKLENLGLYQTLLNSRLLYYTKERNTDYIFEAIECEKYNPNPKEDLYKVCEYLQGNSN